MPPDIMKSATPVTRIEAHTITLGRIADFDLVVELAERLVTKVNLDVSEQQTVIVAAAELAANTLRFAGQGSLQISIVQRLGCKGIEILARDEGPGIADVEKALQRGFSTAPHCRGMGLPSVKTTMTEFEIESRPGRGTRVLTRKWHANLAP